VSRRGLLPGLAAVGAAFLVLAGASAAVADPAPPAGLSARATGLIEASTGRFLYGYAQGARLPIASTTKLMTALLTMEHARLGQVFTQNDYFSAAVDSQIGLVPGERMSVHDLLLALLLPSADDAAEDLAYNVGHGSVGRFVAMMNARARELKLGHTHYTTPIGLDTPGNYSCAADLVKLANYLLAHHPFFRNAVAKPSALLRSGNHPRFVTNRNTLVGRVPWINGVKTGHTSAAGYVLVGSGTRDGMTLISAVLGTPDASARDADTLAVLDYGFAAFRLTKLLTAGTVLARLPVRDQPNRHAAVIAAQTITQVVPRSARVSTRLELTRPLKGPLRRHAVVGRVVVLVGGRAVARVPLLLASAVPAVSTVVLVGRFVTKPLTLVVLVLLLGLGLLVVALGRRGRSGPRPPRGRRARAVNISETSSGADDGTCVEPAEV
jgi:D-alanyl-D-alanine carboxypeptidase (penicillin-binding protein 5/6)